MRKITSVFLLMMSYFAAHAQLTINNPSFENWTDVGAKKEEPQFWNSNQTGGGQAASTFAPQTCFREANNPHSGTYCARVQTGSAVGIAVNGSLTTGRVEAPSTNKSEGYIRTIANDPNFNMPFNGRPDSIIFWYRFTKQGSDYPRVEARLHVGNAYSPEAPVNNNHPDSSVNIIARAVWTGPAATQGSWVRISVPFTYVDNRTPQFILITSTSSGDQTSGTSGSTMWLDDFSLFYQPTVVVGTIAPTTYFVSATQGSTMNIPFTLLGDFTAGNTVTAQLSDASGSFANPTVIGSTTAIASGTIAATIPAATANGTAYRVRLVTSTPSLTSANNGVNLTIINVINSIAPTTTQTIPSATNGTALTVTETAGATSRVWKSAATSGGTYTNITPAQTGTTYSPILIAGGTYYVVCETTYPGGLKVVSNEVIINVIGNSIAPPAPQSIAVNGNGQTLTVTETNPATSREWKYATTTGGPYLSFSPAKTGTTYVPNFATSATYFVVCQSVIGATTVTSNEVEIEVSTPLLSTGTIVGSPFEFSVSAPAASVQVPYFTTSSVFNYTNVFTAQLSDGNGSFSTPTVIGTRQDTTSGIINATIPSSMLSGLAYRIRVISSNIAVNGSNNGVDLIIDQFSTSVSPSASQSILYGTNGSSLTAAPSQTATNEWKFSTTSGGPYTSFSPAQTGATYTPNFAAPGTYYVVVVSKNQYNDEVTSNEVEITVTNGSTLTTSVVTGSPFLVSPSAVVTTSVDFTSDVFFNAGNVFTAELSDNNGSFANPVTIGSLTSSTIGTITATIPNNSVSGTGYRIRVVASNPAIVGTFCTNDLTIVPYEMTVAPNDTQFIGVNQTGTAIVSTPTHTSTYNWLYSDLSGFAYQPFNPAQTTSTCLPVFNTVGTWYVVCETTNSWSDKLTSQEVVVIVSPSIGLPSTPNDKVTIYWSAGELAVDLTQSKAQTATIELLNLSGQVVMNAPLNSASLNRLATHLSEGIYLFHLTTDLGHHTGKIKK